jgi:WD40 repeat protein
VWQAEEALHRALTGSRLIGSVPQGFSTAVSPDGSRFATAGPGYATVWDMATLERLFTLGGHDQIVWGVAFDPTGERIATTGGEGELRLWDATTGELIDIVDAGAALLGVAFDADGERVAAVAEDGTVRLWEVATGRRTDVLHGPDGEGFGVLGWPVVPVFSPDGSLLASGGWGKVGTVWDLASGDVSAVLEGHIWEVSSVDFSPDGTEIATTSPDGTIRFWDPASGEPRNAFAGSTADLYALEYSPDGRRVATGGADGTASVWDAHTGEELMRLAGHTGEVYSVPFTPDGSTLLTASRDITTRIWDVTLAGERDWLTVPGPSLRLGGVAFSPDGRTFAVPADPSGVTIRETETGDVEMELAGHDAVLWDLAYSPDGRLLAGSPGTGVRFRAPENRTVPVWDVRTGKLVASLEGHEDQVSAVEFSPDGRTVVTASFDGTLRSWDTATWRPMRESDAGGDAYGLAFSPDGRWLVAGIGTYPDVRVYDAETFELRGRLEGHADYIQDLAFLGDDRVLSASGDGTVKLWDLSTLEEIMTLGGHAGPVTNVDVSPDGRLIATAGFDGSAKLWDAGSGAELMTFFGHDRIVHSVAFSPDGRFLATASGDGTVMLRLLPIDELRELARERVTRDLTDEECARYLHTSGCLST